jgi:hypothetical protein
MAWLATFTGCASWDLSKSLHWPFGNDEKPAKPEKVLAMWTDTVLYHSNDAPIRGFGGRLMFYEAKNEKPVKVDGKLTVYAFVEDSRQPDNARPDRKYVFTADQLPAHYSKSTIGHSYSVWLPWDEVGGPQQAISLFILFEPKEGAPVKGQITRQMLPGKTPPVNPAVSAIRASLPTAMPAAGALPAGAPAAGVVPTVAPAAGVLPTGGITAPVYPVQQISYEAALPQEIEPRVDLLPGRHMNTATIAIPSGLGINQGMAPNGAVPASPGQMAPAGIASPGTASLGATAMYPGRSAIPGAVAPPPTGPSGPGQQPRARFAPQRPRVLGEPIARLSRDHALTPPRPVGQPYAPAAVQPAPDSGNGATASSSTAGQSPR